MSKPVSPAPAKKTRTTFTSILDSDHKSSPKKNSSYQSKTLVHDKFDGKSKSIFDILGKFD